MIFALLLVILCSFRVLLIHKILFEPLLHIMIMFLLKLYRVPEKVPLTKFLIITEVTFKDTLYL